MPAYPLWIYYALINLLTFFLFFRDKRAARLNQWRIPQRHLLLASLAGGALGSLIGMRLFRHKTKHLVFSWGIPLILMAQIGLLLFFVWVRN
ncbi:MAG: DUF1294 domain-containing protein [Syntrophomonadaceae bacterium]|nr:DUF1294 domain-containing protein [Syntrophomonadaceae bacterium]